MGQSTPTTTDAFDVFEHRYAGFRAELDRGDQARFDEALCRARRRSNAINRLPELDFERPVFMAMLIEAMHDLDEERRLRQLLENDVQEIRDALIDAGLVVRRLPASPPFHGRGVGQARLHDALPAGAVPA